MDNTIIYSRKNLAPIIFEAFSYLQEKNLIISLFRYATETTPNSGKENERLVKLDDGNGHKLTGLFLKASKESMMERNARRAPRWFETPFVVNGQEYYLSSQWNASGNFQLTLPVLNHFLRECCRNEADGTTYSIYKSGDEFIFAQGDFDDNADVPQKGAASTDKDIKQKTVLDKDVEPRQTIFFGAPGTGKSYKVNELIQEQQTFRTTFHPDYDYAQFVGAYKPKKEGEKITYSFVPQVFAKAYAAAWRLQLSDDANKNVFLVIEEINRGNCAQIFGDIFQLLDRDGDGFSQYSIDADCDFAEWLDKEFKAANLWDAYKKEVGDEGKLKLPPNLNILATMNTSDQSLFPMDSAFKRRFDWEYVPISFDGKDAANFQIDVDGFQYSWQKFVETVNEKILTLTESEDKQLGEFFIKPESGNVISKDRFLGKVMFYLWNEVCKDEHKNGSFFRTKDGDKEKYFTFQDLYRDKGLLKRFIEKLFEEGPSQE